MIPSLDLSGTKRNTDYKDWYGYSQKLEKSVRILQGKNEQLMKDLNMQNNKLADLKEKNKNLYGIT
jgi:hypothetical protein